MVPQRDYSGHERNSGDNDDMIIEWLQRVLNLAEKGRLVDRLRGEIQNYQMKNQQLDEKVASLQGRNNQLSAYIQQLEGELKRLQTDYSKVISKLAKDNRDQGSVYSSGKTLQPITLERDYLYFLEHDIGNLRRKILKYLSDDEAFMLPDLRNKVEAILTSYILSREQRGQRNVEEILLSITEHVNSLLKITALSSSESLNKELRGLIKDGRKLANDIESSGGELKFYGKDEPFKQEYHDSIPESQAGMIIQYTVNPAYLVDAARIQEVSYKKAQVKAKVVVGDPQQ